MRETERRFLVDPRHLPPLAKRVPATLVRQAYPWRGLDLRVRHTRPLLPDCRPKGVVTLKFARAGASRIEIETPIPACLADFLVRRLARRIEKQRYLLPAAGGLSFEIDRYAGRLEGLWTAEIEFPGETRAEPPDLASFDFTRPGWLGAEITHDRRYDNLSLAFDGMPRGDAFHQEKDQRNDHA